MTYDNRQNVKKKKTTKNNNNKEKRPCSNSLRFSWTFQELAFLLKFELKRSFKNKIYQNQNFKEFICNCWNGSKWYVVIAITVVIHFCFRYCCCFCCRFWLYSLLSSLSHLLMLIMMMFCDFVVRNVINVADVPCFLKIVFKFEVREVLTEYNGLLCSVFSLKKHT